VESVIAISNAIHVIPATLAVQIIAMTTIANKMTALRRVINVTQDLDMMMMKTMIE
jgi:hypothetical protein